MKISSFQQLEKNMIRLLIVFLITIASLAQASGIAQAQVRQTTCNEIWNTVVTVTNLLGSTRDLSIGQGLSATTGVDDCDVLAPPLPPSGFEAVLFVDPNNYFTDYRPANVAGAITWLVNFQAGSGGSPVTFSWSTAALPGAGTLYLQDTVTGKIVDVDMRSSSSAQIPSGLTQLQIVYTTTRCKVTAITSGNWNTTGTWNTNCSGIPATTDDVYIPSGITVSFNNTATTVESLTIGAGGRLSFANANLLTISDNAFVRGGTLDLGSVGNLTVSGALTNLGVMQQTKTVNVLAPAATVSFLSIGGYGGLTLTSNATSMGSTTVGIIGGQICDTSNSSVWHCFTIKPATSVSDAGIIFYYSADELNSSACSTMQAWRSTGGSNWISAGTVGTRSCTTEPYSVSYTGATIQNTGSYFALRSTTYPTAIKLLAFHASSGGDNAFIWLTIGLVGLASVGGVAIWRISGKRKGSLRA